MKASEFEKELERVGLAQKHADEAFAWLREHGERGRYNILYHGMPPNEKVAWAVLDEEGNRYYMRWTAVLVYLFACKDKRELVGEPPFDEEWETNEVVQSMFRPKRKRVFEKLGIKIVQYGEDRKEFVESDEESSSNKIISILEQFNQIIFYGPPGTGKTRRAKLAVARLFDLTGNNHDVLQKLQEQESEDRCWNIVQFHPSYNYEDFVRGIKVETTGSDDNSHVAYKTVNRIFGEMCNIAKDNPDSKHVLIIDEINRANVSAVLGELIYALEYRDEPVNTPYKVDGKEDIIVPKNLYIIGTMNSADRTIGQIDYAVRRRFAFVPCPPDRSVIKDENAREFFDDVDAIFTRHISQDYDADDVRIGHSYFLASGIKLANKIIYQVVPILREYVKDGVLKKNAESEIDRIEERAKKLLASESENSDSPAEDLSKSESEGRPYFYWRNGGRYGLDGVGRTAFGVIRDYINQNLDKNVAELQTDVGIEGHRYDLIADMDELGEVAWKNLARNRYFTKDNEIIQLTNGKKVVICSQWEARDDSFESPWGKFKKKMKDYGYSIGSCHIVNVGEDAHTPDVSPSRSWEDSYKFGFVSGRGKGYQKNIEKLKKGDFIFVSLTQTKDGCNGYVACGEVVEEIVDIKDFRTVDNVLLSDCDVGGGQTYRQKYPRVFEEKYPDYAVRVRWLKSKPRNEAIEGCKKSRQFRASKIQQKTFKILREEFALTGWDK